MTIDFDRNGGTGKGPGPKVRKRPKRDDDGGSVWSIETVRLLAIAWAANRGDSYALYCIRMLSSEDSQYDSVLDEIDRCYGKAGVTQFTDWVNGRL